MKLKPSSQVQNLFSLLAILTLILEFAFVIVKVMAREYEAEFPLYYLLLTLPFVLKFFWFVLVTRQSGLFSKFIGYLFLISLLVYGLGLLAKLEHYSWAGVALTYGGFGAIVIYSIRFILKNEKRLLDLVKLIFLISYIIIGIMVLEHYISSGYGLLHTLLFYLLIFIFSHEKDKGKFSEKEVFSFEENNPIERDKS